ncbi:hypothetical protein [Nocardioides sp.]|uniref:hypothetical protein n=1 Tax=Nocardioides sp. TaxID=35761 RepID=UPI002D80D4E6|nr:hypothetical protein [Nocardioides sp.]HET8961143.1 hypothetical protein [Nocardioides sp.]
MSPVPALRITRRTTLGGVLAAATVLVGCDLDPRDPGSSSEPPADADDPDAALVEDVAADIFATRQLVESLQRRHGSLRRPLNELVRVHDAHLAALESSRRSGRRAPRPGNAADALRLVRDRELRLQRLLADHSVAARSGRLARLLASMSAAIAQQLAALPGGESR